MKWRRVAFTAVYGGAIGLILLFVLIMASMSFVEPGDHNTITGPAGLVGGMTIAIIWLVKRDRDLHSQLSEQNNKLIASLEKRIADLEQELANERSKKQM